MSFVQPPQKGAAPAAGWLLDELARAGRENLDPAHVARYDALEDAAAAEEIVYLRRCLAADAVVADLGAGTGQFALAAATEFARVIAIDVSAPMLDRLRHKLATVGLTNVTLTSAGFLTYRHEGEPVDLAYSRYALHHLPDAWKAIALSRIRRMTREGGLLRLWDVVYNFGPDEAPDRFEAWCASAGDGTDGQWSRRDLEEHIRDEHSTYSWLLEPMIRTAGFHIEEVSYSPDGMFAKYLARAV
jgi:ubiquinone/menaquinone biosynthesis C-methylase UbiE